jgi:heme/copper-type cytochrome/quinol oxidase subunit 2
LKQNPERYEREMMMMMMMMMMIIIIIIIIIIKIRKRLDRESEKRGGKWGFTEKMYEIVLNLFAEFRSNFPNVADYVVVTLKGPLVKMLLKL